MELTFVSYDGDYPNLCSGTLILAIDGNPVVFPRDCLRSGGSVRLIGYVKKGSWNVSNWPEGFPEELKERAIDLVNKNVKPGCCGGCI